MTTKKDDIVIERDVPLPKRKNNNERESLGSLPLSSMEKGDSFFIETRDEEHTVSKLSAVRSAVSRFTDANAGFVFRVFKWRQPDSDDTPEVERGKRGIRVFCSANDNTRVVE